MPVAPLPALLRALEQRLRAAQRPGRRRPLPGWQLQHSCIRRCGKLPAACLARLLQHLLLLLLLRLRLLLLQQPQRRQHLLLLLLLLLQ